MSAQSTALVRRITVAAIALSSAAIGMFLPARALADPAGAQVVINEVYGGGGNSGSHYKADFVEL